MKRKSSAYTLFEVCAVVFIMGSIALAVTPVWQKSVARKRESNIKALLIQYRQGINAFRRDVGCYPSALTDVAKQMAPATCVSDAGVTLNSLPGDYRGPYLQFVPTSNVGTIDHTLSINYSTASGTGTGVGSVYVTSTVGTTDSDGRAFSNY